MRLLNLLLACAAAPGETGSAGTTTSTETDTGFGWAPADPTWTADEVGAELQAAIDVGLPDPASLLGGVAWALAQGDPGGCPLTTSAWGLQESFQGCTASSGWFYAGLTLYQEVDDGWELAGDGTVVDPEGVAFACAGYARSYRTGDAWLARYAGVWGHPDVTGWMGHVPDFALDTWGDASGDVNLEGGWGPDGRAIAFDGVRIAETVSGSLRARDPAGGWYVLPLDADGCGTVDWYGTALGDACVDLLPAAADLRARLEAG